MNRCVLSLFLHAGDSYSGSPVVFSIHSVFFGPPSCSKWQNLFKNIYIGYHDVIMKILGIETSCDETAVALLEANGENFVIESELVASQIKDHAKYGGVVPEVAARKHVDVLFGLFDATGVDRTGKEIDLIAVTRGPGLAPALRVGVEAAKTLSTFWNKPLVGVNHLEGHICSVLLDNRARLQFPALVLVVSGGHTELVIVKGQGEYELIGETRDDAAGEAFDKVAKLIGLPYPGGPEVSRLATQGDRSAISLPRPMLDSPGFDFSFSGLKTAVLYHLKDNPETDKIDLCASFEEAVVEVLVTKTKKAIDKYNPKLVLLVGGVSANKYLRERMQQMTAEEFGLSLLLAPLQYTGDNAAMIAVAGYWQASRQDYSDPLILTINANLNL